MLFSRQEIRQIKENIRWFLQNHYSDERLLVLLYAARSGELNAWRYDRCLLGLSTVRFDLKIFFERSGRACFAESAFFRLGFYPRHAITDDGAEMRRRRLIPMVLAEMKRRELASRAKTSRKTQAITETMNKEEVWRY